jgi:protein-tyrosine-phosphatase/DNA-binding HxlR family transcriptional regulator
MSTGSVPPILSALAHELRWGLVQALSHGGDLRVFELAERVQQPQNIVSYHLKRLRESGVVRVRRSEADSRDVYYALDIPAVRSALTDAGAQLYPVSRGPAQPKRVLFVCTHNSARSQMAEGLTRVLGAGRVQAFSAGSQPLSVHPEAAMVMAARGVDLSGQAPHHLSDYEGQAFDVVVTVCDRAREVCPAFGGAPLTLHWSLPDPLAVAVRSERLAAFEAIADELRWRVEVLLVMMGAA